MVVGPLSEEHRGQIETAALQALRQWAPQAKEAPQVVEQLDRVLLFLRQNGQPSTQARQVASLAFSWGEQIRRSAAWQWMNVSDDEQVNPGLVSPTGQWACLAVDVVTSLVLARRGPSLSALYRRICLGELPPPTLGAVTLVPAGNS